MTSSKLLTVVFSLFVSTAATVNANAEILIGIAAPITGSYAWTGERVVKGAEIAIEDLNAEGGVLGQPLRPVVVDDFCNGEQAIAAAEKLIEAEVNIVIGHQCSGAMIPASELYEAAGIIVISPAATNPLVTDRGLQMVFRTSGRDDQQGTIAGDTLAEGWKNKNIAIIHDGQAYGQGIAGEVIERLEELGTAAQLVEQIEPGQKDFSVLIEQMRSASTDAVFYGGYQQEAGLIVRQAKEQLPSLQFVLPDGVSGDDFPLIAGDAADGVLMTSLADPRQRPSAESVVKRFREIGFEPLSSTLYAYAAVQVWAEAVNETERLTPMAVSAALKNGEFDTVLGRLRFDAKGDATGIDHFDWFQWKDGEYTPIDGPKF